MTSAGGGEVNRGLSGTADGDAAWAENPDESNEHTLRVTQITAKEIETRRTFIARHLTTINGVDHGRMKKIANDNKLDQGKTGKSQKSGKTFASVTTTLDVCKSCIRYASSNYHSHLVTTYLPYP